MKTALVEFIAKHIDTDIETKRITADTCCAFTGAPLASGTEAIPLKTVIKPATANLADTFRFNSDVVTVETAKCFAESRLLRGNIGNIRQMLKNIATIGKKRSQGYGKIIKWNIEQIEDFPYWHDGRLIKNFPVGCPIPKFPQNIVFDMYEAPWTPPYWLATIFKVCIV